MLILPTLLLFGAERANGTHVIGGEVTYKFVDSESGGNKYVFNLVIYEDCQNGSPYAIEADNPAFVAIYNGDRRNVYYDSIQYALADTVAPNLNIECLKNPPATCMIKKSFNISVVLPANASGYTFCYQRCCRNGGLVNIEDPVDVGSVFYCEIPPAATAHNNNSAVFKNYPPQIICVNYPLLYDNSALDADGDSLSYELCTSYNSDNHFPTDTVPPPPPYEPTTYVHPPYSFYNPMTGGPPLAIDPVTGMITGTPLWIGRYLVTVCCNEWRHGTIINTVHREFQFVVTDCSKTVEANMPSLPNDLSTYILNCRNYTVNFQNTSIGGSSWYWNFGAPGTIGNTSTDFQPTFTYPDSGTYTVKLIANPNTSCSDSIIKKVKIYPPFNAAFVDTGNLCPGAPVGFIDKSNGTINKVISWGWNFGDGTIDSNQNAIHVFSESGTYYITLVSENTKNCIDTVVTPLVIENFKPFAGNDTVILKGQSIQFNAVGGLSYEWIPGNYLNNPQVGNPLGFFPDPGLFSYRVNVSSSLGCQATDTVNVWVVNQTELFLPNAFTPNGDGKNDVLRPIAVGYKSINYFKVFDRFGQCVFKSQSVSDGWDGTFKGQNAELGTYFWELSFIDISGKTSVKKGDVTLIR